MERQREELKKEKDEYQNEKAKRIKCERTIMEAVRKSEKVVYLFFENIVLVN